MKIAWFTHRYYPCVGGSENYGREMVARFVARGDAVDVFTSDALDLWYFTDRCKDRIDGPRRSAVDGARVTRFPVRHLPGQRYLGRLLSYLPHWPTRCRFESFMPIIPGLGRVRGEYDGVFAVGFPYTAFAYSAWRTARAAGAPLVLTPFLHLSTPGDPVHRTYTRPHQVRLLRESRLVVVQTAIEAAQVAEWGIPRDRILTLGMGVRHDQVTGGDRERYRARLGVPSNNPLVGQLGANDANKGTTHLVQAVAALNEARPEGNPVRLVLAGPVSPSFQEFRESLPAEYGRWLTVLGPIPDADRADFFAAIDVFAMPSRTDSFGIVFLEAWANAKPVVAAASGGVAEVVEDGRTGVLIPYGNVATLREALQNLLDDPGLAARLGQEGARKVARGYSWDDRFATLAAALDGCLRPGGRRSVGLFSRPPGGSGDALNGVGISNGQKSTLGGERGFRSA